MEELLDRIRAINFEQSKWETMPGNHAPKLTEDLTHWAAQGVSTPDQLDMLLITRGIEAVSI